MGVEGAEDGEHGRDRESALIEGLRETVADTAIADLIMILAECDQPRGGDAGIDRVAVDHAPERGPRAVVEEAAGTDLRERRQRSEVGVVAGGLTRHRDVQSVVVVVAPLRRGP